MCITKLTIFEFYIIFIQMGMEQNGGEQKFIRKMDRNVIIVSLNYNLCSHLFLTASTTMEDEFGIGGEIREKDFEDHLTNYIIRSRWRIERWMTIILVPHLNMLTIYIVRTTRIILLFNRILYLLLLSVNK